MLSTLFILVLGGLLLALVGAPLLFPDQADPLPDARDPLLQELSEERDALFRAIRELEAREDLAPTRRGELRARYEAKAAKVLRALDDRQGVLAGLPVAPPKVRRRPPYAALALLGVGLVTASLMGGFILPRVGENATVTTTDIEAATALRDLQRSAERDPSQANLLALADAYWQLQEADNAEATYLRLAATTPTPAVAYQRLGYLSLQDDLAAAQGYFEQAREIEPSNLDTLFTLAELYFSQARPDDAVEALETFLAQPEGAGDEEVAARLETFRAVAPVLNAATADPSEANLLALAETYWILEERERAADIYVRVLSSFDPHQALALSRIGQVLFFSGRNEEAIDLLERAQEVDPSDLDTLLFLGNAQFSLERYAAAIETWESYVDIAGEADAGRVPSLIENAQARLAQGPPEEQTDPSEVLAVSAETLYQDNCSGCHGVEGGGGAGPRLAGNASAARSANVRDIIQYGRGMMPGFGARLSEEELTALTDYVVTVLAEGEAAQTLRLETAQTTFQDSP